MAIAKKRLGRGLGALINGGVSVPNREAQPAKKNKPTHSSQPTKGNKKQSPSRPAPEKLKPFPPSKKPTQLEPISPYQELFIDAIEPNPHQPRREIDSNKIEELANSIRAEGLLQPIVVRKNGQAYQLVAGHRRLLACKSIGLKKISAKIVDMSDASSAVVALIENLQREGLNPIEESLGYASLMRDFDLTQEAISQRVGKSRPVIANALRLLTLSATIQGYIAKGLLSIGHAKVLLGLEEPENQELLARRIIEEALNVRDAEEAVRKIKTKTIDRLAPIRSAHPDLAIQALEKQMAQQLSTKVFLKHGAKKGRIVIEYYGNDDLQRILERTGLAPAH